MYMILPKAMHTMTSLEEALLTQGFFRIRIAVSPNPPKKYLRRYSNNIGWVKALSHLVDYANIEILKDQLVPVWW